MAQVTFRIHYDTRWGENLFLERKLPGKASGTQRLPMNHVGDGFWTLALDEMEPSGWIQYRYLFQGINREQRLEPLFRAVEVTGTSQSVWDYWFSAEESDAAFLRQAFAGIVFQPSRLKIPSVPAVGPRRLRLTLRAPRVTAGYRICVSGDHRLLGGWNPARAVVMSGEHYPLWQVELPLDEMAQPVEFKFGLWSEKAARLVSLEAGANRRLQDLPQDWEVVVVNCEHFRHDTLWKGAGVAIPVFALRSEHGYGIGEFADLEAFSEWAATCGLHLVQLLPVNDTSTDSTWKDSYPYKAISTAALHPIYLSIARLFADYRVALPKDYLARRDALNRLPQLDYEAVLKDKLVYLRQLYAVVGAQAHRSPQFKAFLREAGDWLKPYAAFCRLRDQQGTADFSRWGEHAAYSEKRIRPWFKAGAPEYDEVMFHCFVQYHLKEQLDRALAAGHARGVAFKGDLPIGIDRSSVEAWTEPELFHMDRQTGAPPDFFSALGQNWGFPTYNWARMEADGYAWWRRRLHRMSACFDALRIDHILGFFRIWEIPRPNVEGILGRFNPALPLSPAEIRTLGFTRNVEKFTVPAVAKKHLRKFFGKMANRVAAQLLFRDDDGFFRIRPEFAKVEALRTWLAKSCSQAEAARIADGMKRLGYEVLFLDDLDQPARFHPRIGLPDSTLAQSLPADEQTVLRELHDDFFFRRHTRFWEDEAMKKLPALMDATQMLICGEDLGMIPDSVPVVLKRLGLLSLEVQNMSKRLGQRFGNPQEYPYLSVCTTSTHDTPTLRGWWEEDAEGRQDYWAKMMKREGDAPDRCTPEICRILVEHSLASASMWCILPWQDWLSLEPNLRHPDAAAERINVPANPRQYWRYRMHLTIEALQQATAFNETISRLVAASGRQPAA